MAEEIRTSEEIFKEFKEHSITEFFRKNSQMLGYSGKVRSLTTVVHEYVTNGLDACEEAGILPNIEVEVKELAENKYGIRVQDNGPGIPKKMVGKALASVLSGTKFHRYMQQRGQQGIGAAGCTLFALITTGKGIHVKSGTGKEAYECDLTIDIKSNKPVASEVVDLPKEFRGLSVYGEFGDIKYEKSDHGVYEYIRRTALSNPHVSIKLTEPDGTEVIFPRSVETMPRRPKQIKPHPLGVSTSDLLDFARMSASRKVSSFLEDVFSRVTHDKVKELAGLAKEVDFEKEPKDLTWADAEALVRAFRQVKWIAPEMDSMSTIGEEQIAIAIKNIIDPTFQSVVERKPRVFKGGIPFVVEVGIAYGGKAGKSNGQTVSGNVLRFANKVPLLFDNGSCAITEAVGGVDWKRYSIKRFDEEPVSVLVNVSSVYIPYSGVGKQAIAQEDEIIEEIKLAVMDAGRKLERYLSGERHRNMQETGYNMIVRYVGQLSGDLGAITGKKKEDIEKDLKSLIEKKYRSLFKEKQKEKEDEAQGKKEAPKALEESETEE
jgi:DNA topoisomerase-6 subunit B